MKIQGIKTDTIYKTTACSRCGETVLRKYLGTEVLDGGFSREDKFEDRPAGWEYHDTTGMLCPVCEELYKLQLKSFMEYKEIPKVKINYNEWKSCDVCAPSCLLCKNSKIIENSISTICRECKDYSKYEPKYNYCPSCGRPLTEQAWKELERKLCVE